MSAMRVRQALPAEWLQAKASATHRSGSPCGGSRSSIGGHRGAPRPAFVRPVIPGLHDARVTSPTEPGQRYATALRAAEQAAVSVEPEAQLTMPVSQLFSEVASASAVGRLDLLREARLVGVRPDFAALLNGRPIGWLELKAPGHDLDGSSWRGRERTQWERLAELDALVVCNGTAARLYRLGEAVGDDVHLPYDSGEGWDPAGLVTFLERWASIRPPVVTRVSQLAERLAPLTRALRERLEASLTAGGSPDSGVARARAAWAAHVHENANDQTFADDLAQVIGYSLAITALRGTGDRDSDGYITLREAQEALRGPNQVLAAALGPALDVPELAPVIASEVAAIERLASVVDAERVARTRDSRGEPWLWFYEDFLASYNPTARKAAGVYYTPTAVVQCQVRLLDHFLRVDLERPLGFGSADVVTLDPATGSGTYPLAVIDCATEVALERRGTAGPAQIAQTLQRNLLAFELLPGPYAVAHLRVGQRLADVSGLLFLEPAQVFLTDTLDDPDAATQQPTLWGDIAVLAAERERARAVDRADEVAIRRGDPVLLG